MTSLKLGNVNENDETTMVLLVLHWKSSLLGCVYYLHQFRELYFIMDVKNMDLKDIVLECKCLNDRPSFLIRFCLLLVLHQIQPTHVILCKSNDPELTTIIENYGMYTIEKILASWISHPRILRSGHQGRVNACKVLYLSERPSGTHQLVHRHHTKHSHCLYLSSTATALLHCILNALCS